MATNRYRCTGCGNLTRFDVAISRRTREYHHFTVGGDLEVEAVDRKSTRLNSSHVALSRMPSSA